MQRDFGDSKKSINICFFFGSLSEGGIGRVTSVIINALCSEPRYQLFALQFIPSNKKQIYFLNDAVHHEFLVNKRISMKDAILRYKGIDLLKKYIKSNSIDIIVACGDIYFPIVVCACKNTNAKSVCWDHTGPNINSDIKFQLLSRRLGARFSDYNLVLTKAALVFYDKKYRSGKNYQIYNPIDPVLSNNNSTYNTKAKSIISVGRFSYQKNFERLLDIAAIILKSNKDWTWDIYGDGENRLNLEDKCKKLRIDKQVCFRGQVSNIYDLYKQYAMIVMTSRYEGFPMTLLEACSQGLPMVAFDVETGPNEIIKNGENGYLCSANSNEEMVKCIQLLIDNDDLRLKMAHSSYMTSITFDIGNIIYQWKNMIDEIRNN